MTFLNPLVLLGLAAAAIPVILHLLNRRKLRIVEFSSLRFLKELQHTSLRRLKLRQWLLLLLRTLLIVALVLAFARPVVRGNLARFVGSRARNSMVFVMDDSPSMTVRTERGMMFDRAREAANRILQLAEEDDRVAVLPLSALSTGASHPGYEEPRVARSLLQHLEPSQVARPFREALPALRRLVQDSRDANREVFLFTDAQASQYAGDSSSVDSLAVFEKDVRAFLVRTGVTPSVNVGVITARMDTRFPTGNRPARVLVELRNFSDSPIRQETVSLYLNGTRVAQQSIDLPAEGNAVTALSFVPKRSGILSGYAAIDDDALEADNTLHFVITIPEVFRVLEAGPGSENVRYPLLALTLGGDSLTAGRVSARHIAPEQLPVTDLSSTDVLLLNGLDALTPTEGAAAANFVRRGGAIILFPGAGLNASSYNDHFWKPLGLPGMAPGTESEATTASPHTPQESFVSFSTVDEAHPLFAGLFETQRKKQTAGIESPRVRRSAGLRPGGKGLSIITLSNGEAFLAEYQIGAGRVLAFGVDPGTAWSDFPLKGIFAPLLHRAVAYCSTTSEEESTATVGAPLRFTVRSGGAASSQVHTIISPSGLEERVTAHVRAGSGTLDFVSSPTVETGVYRLRRGSSGSEASTTLAAHAVALPSWEGDLKSLRDEDLPAFWSALGLREGAGRAISTEGNLEQDVAQSRFGLELWRYFLLLAVLLALAEMVVGRDRDEEEQPR
jgi:hypothetical protein